jgi:integrase
MGRPKTGSHRWRNGQLYAVISYKDDDTGKQKFKERRVTSNRMTDLPAAIRELQNEFAQDGQEAVEAAKVTFERAAREYAKEHIQPAEIVNDRKVSGLKRPGDAERWLETLIAHFGKKPIRKIGAKEIKQYKNQRLKTKTRRKTNYSIASVNRELEILRAVFRFAHGHGWVLKNPFILSRGIINKADENERMTILTPEQEAAILAQCVPPRSHLRSVVIVGIDTFLRAKELFSLVKSDIDFKARVIRVRQTTTKTMRRREIGLTDRAYDELFRLTEYLPDDARIFTLGSVKRSWATACRLAGVTGVRIHDLRHTGITRRLIAVVNARLPWQIVMKESGHTNIKTFMRYFNPNDETLAAAARAMSELYSENGPAHINSELTYSSHINAP